MGQKRGFRVLHSTVAGVLVAVVTVVVAGCSPVSTASPVSTTAAAPAGPDVTDVTFWKGDGGPLKFDACLPADSTEPAPAVLLIHGGGFVQGSRDSMKQLCGQLSDRGYAAFSIDYRLAPNFVYPSQVDDVAAAVSWLRQPENATSYHIDPARIALVGSSAGAILAQELGARGTGALTAGDRVAAVVSLSGVSLMTASGLALGKPGREGVAMILAYLGCTSTDAGKCPQSEAASALTQVDPTDPPMLLFNSDNELVPKEQAQSMHDALGQAGVTSELEIVAGTQHGVQLLNQQNRQQLFDFLDSTLA